MANMQIISETPVNIYQLKKELERIKKRDSELNFRATRTDENLNQIATYKSADELFEKIFKLNIPRLKEQHIHKVIDVMPATVTELKHVLQGYTITVSNESIEKIMSVINEFLEKK